MRFEDPNSREDASLSTRFPLLVIGTTMAVLILYLVIGESLRSEPKVQARVFVQPAAQTLALSE